MTRNSPARRAAHGFTLIELMTVVAVTGIVMSAAVPSLNGLVEGQRQGGIASQLASDLQFARSESVLRNEGVRVTFRTSAEGQGCYVIHTGAADQCTCDGATPASCEGGAQALKTVSIEAADHVGIHANVGSLRFDPEHGTATPAATVRVVGAQGRTVQHVVNIMGRVRSCSPQAMVSGYRAC